MWNEQAVLVLLTLLLVTSDMEADATGEVMNCPKLTKTLALYNRYVLFSMELLPSKGVDLQVLTVGETNGI